MLNEVVTPCWRGVEEEFRAGVPEDFVGWKLDEYLGIVTRLEGLDCGVLPFWEGRGEADVSGSEDADEKSGDGVVGGYAAAVGVGDGDAVVVVGDVFYDCVEKEPGVVFSEEFGGLAFEEGV